jgi:glycosyltransferase involved in cell wall biosynthesis
LNVGYVSYLDPFKFSGGAELSLRELLWQGRELGHKIEIYSVLGGEASSEEILKDKDVFILADIYNSYIHPSFFSHKVMNAIVNGLPYVHIDRSYVDTCNIGYLPCNGNVNDTICPFKSKGFQPRRSLASVLKIGAMNAVTDRRNCFRMYTSNIYTNSLLNVFSSPLHCSVITKLQGSDTVGRKYIIKPIIRTERFQNKNIHRDIDYLYVGAINKAKGIENIRKRFPDGNVVLIGNPTKEAYKNYGKWIEKVPHQEIANYYNRAKNFIHLPKWPEPLGRGVIEAALCGCNLILNENVGAMSFNFEINNPGEYRDSSKEFWEYIEAIL